MELLKVVSAKYASDFKINVTFNNGCKLVCDLANTLRSEVFEPLQDKAKFKKFSVNDGVVEWPGEIDIAPEYLYKIGVAQPGSKKLPEPEYVSWTA